MAQEGIWFFQNKGLIPFVAVPQFPFEGNLSNERLQSIHREEQKRRGETTEEAVMRRIQALSQDH